MNDPTSENFQEKIRLQYDIAPYPARSIDQNPANAVSTLMLHSLITPYYLAFQRVASTQGKWILDAGCGSGFTSLLLGFANPGATIVGVDLSPGSIEIARQRLQHYGFDRAEFHAMALEDVPGLGMTFDFINCDEVLYLTPDPKAAMRAMASVLKPNGIIRTNLHSQLQRAPYYRAQEVFRIMKLLEGDTGELEVELVKQVMNALLNQVALKRSTWEYDSENDESIRANYLIQGDRGFTVTDMFELLRAANMELLSMVNWQQWDLMSLFQNPDDLPPFLAMSLPNISEEERLHLFELLQPIHRLLDFWCIKQSIDRSFIPYDEWSDDRWQTAWIHLHPQLTTEQVREHLIDCVRLYQPWNLSQYAFDPQESTEIDSSLAACLLPLWQGKQSFPAMVEHWRKLHPVDRITLQPTDPTVAARELKGFLIGLKKFPYLLIEAEDTLPDRDP